MTVTEIKELILNFKDEQRKNNGKKVMERKKLRKKIHSTRKMGKIAPIAHKLVIVGDSLDTIQVTPFMFYDGLRIKFRLGKLRDIFPMQFANLALGYEFLVPFLSANFYMSQDDRALYDYFSQKLKPDLRDGEDYNPQCDAILYTILGDDVWESDIADQFLKYSDDDLTYLSKMGDLLSQANGSISAYQLFVHADSLNLNKYPKDLFSVFLSHYPELIPGYKQGLLTFSFKYGSVNDTAGVKHTQITQYRKLSENYNVGSSYQESTARYKVGYFSSTTAKGSDGTFDLLASYEHHPIWDENNGDIVYLFPGLRLKRCGGLVLKGIDPLFILQSKNDRSLWCDLGYIALAKVKGTDHKKLVFESKISIGSWVKADPTQKIQMCMRLSHKGLDHQKISRLVLMGIPLNTNQKYGDIHCKYIANWTNIISWTQIQEYPDKGCILVK